MIGPIQTIDNIRIFSVEDIIAMKVQAILGRGKKKDFWDIADAEESEEPISLKKQAWETVKAFISKKVNEYLK
ncbi:MAG: nucleotidyl transferase AbiEii/AbiGii toxin family protein [Bacteroidetes bacterium]|nr:nucleotidyl transferase AbiEii/AbiGii toxin family protein [Bacteroidota bacterium]